MNYPPNHYSLSKMFTNVEKHLGKYDVYLFEKLITIMKLNLINFIRNDLPYRNCYKTKVMNLIATKSFFIMIQLKI